MSTMRLSEELPASGAARAAAEVIATDDWAMKQRAKEALIAVGLPEHYADHGFALRFDQAKPHQRRGMLEGVAAEHKRRGGTLKQPRGLVTRSLLEAVGDSQPAAMPAVAPAGGLSPRQLRNAGLSANETAVLEIDKRVKTVDDIPRMLKVIEAFWQNRLERDEIMAVPVSDSPATTENFARRLQGRGPADSTAVSIAESRNSFVAMAGY